MKTLIIAKVTYYLLISRCSAGYVSITSSSPSIVPRIAENSYSTAINFEA
jgi:hypothetical protein